MRAPCLLLCVAALARALAPAPAAPLVSGIVLSGSRYAFNYRHSAGAGAVSALLRARGVPEASILLAVAEAARGPFAPSPPAIDAAEEAVGAICGLVPS